jgi:hypothetical protein
MQQHGQLIDHAAYIGGFVDCRDVVSVVRDGSMSAKPSADCLVWYRSAVCTSSVKGVPHVVGLQ